MSSTPVLPSLVALQQTAREGGRAEDCLSWGGGSPLYSYTHAREVEANGATLTELLADLDRQYPGLRFRVIDEQNDMRVHMRFFVNGE